MPTSAIGERSSPAANRTGTSSPSIVWYPQKDGNGTRSRRAGPSQRRRCGQVEDCRSKPPSLGRRVVGRIGRVRGCQQPAAGSSTSFASAGAIGEGHDFVTEGSFHTGRAAQRDDEEDRCRASPGGGRACSMGVALSKRVLRLGGAKGEHAWSSRSHDRRRAGRGNGNADGVSERLCRSERSRP